MSNFPAEQAHHDSERTSPMNDIMFTRTALTEAAETAGVTTGQARTILEAAGVTVQPEPKPLPTEPGSVIIATEVSGLKGEWRMFRDTDGVWFSAEPIRGCRWHSPDCITAGTKARIVPVATTPVTLTKGEVGEIWRGQKSMHLGEFEHMDGSLSASITATVNAALAQHAAPAEDVPHLIRQAKAEAWWEGWDAETAWQDDIDHRTIPTVERKDNPYAEEAT